MVEQVGRWKQAGTRRTGSQSTPTRVCTHVVSSSRNKRGLCESRAIIGFNACKFYKGLTKTVAIPLFPVLTASPAATQSLNVTQQQISHSRYRRSLMDHSRRPSRHERAHAQAP